LVWFGLVWFGLVGFSFNASLGPNEGPERGAALRKPLLLATLFGTRRNIPRNPDPILGWAACLKEFMTLECTCGDPHSKYPFGL
jgi:hypothetical protein